MRMDRDQKIRFLKEIVFSAEEIQKDKDSAYSKLFDSFKKGMSSKDKEDNLNLKLSEEDFDEVIEESPWVVDAVFLMIENFNNNEEIDFGHDQNFKMNHLYDGIQDLMSKFEQFEKEQKDF